MRKFYDEFIQQKPKDMSKTLEDITYKYINPETNEPTKVPAKHFEDTFGKVLEIEVTRSVNRQFLNIMYSQLTSLKKENEELFYQALICMDNNLNPKDMRLSDQVALQYTYGYVQDKKAQEKKDFIFLSEDISNAYEEAKTNKEIQKTGISVSNALDTLEESYYKDKSDSLER